MKTAKKRKNDHFLVIPLKYVNRARTLKLWAIAHENDNKTRKWRVLGHDRRNVSCFTFVKNHPWTPKLWAITDENGHKTQKDEFLVIPLKYVNRPGTPKLWAITHENGHKTEKDEFLVITLKHVNRPGTPKLWEIAHENNHNTLKLWLFGQTSQTCKSPWNTKTMVNNLWNGHKMQKHEFLARTLKHVNRPGTPKL